MAPSKKRRSSPAADDSEDSPSKRSKQNDEEYYEEEEQEEMMEADDATNDSGDDDEGDEEDDDDERELGAKKSINPKGGGPALAGIIQKIKLENFMCHRKFSIDFCPNVNFISGQNGSGKSAILAALQICLGAGARRTHRARNLKELICKDSPDHANAKVQVTLTNGGDDAFQPDRFGSLITVERTITRGSGYNGYKLLNEHDKEVSRNKKDLIQLLDHLNIQVENPVAILDQEDAKKFLLGKDSDKYKFFSKATELERIDLKYGEIKESIEKMKKSYSVADNNIKDDAKKVGQYQEEYNKVKELDNLRNKVSQLDAEYYWAAYQGMEEEFEAKKIELEKAREKYTRRVKELKTLQEQLTGDDGEQDRLQNVLNGFVKEADEATNEKKSSEREVKIARQHINAKLRELEQITRHETKAKARFKKAQRDLHAERQRIIEGAAQSEAARRLAEIEKCEKRVEELKAKADELKEQRTTQQRLCNEKEPVYEGAKHRGQSLRSQMNAVLHKIQSLEGGSANSVAQFGRKCPKVCALIQQKIQRGSFRGPVLGPIGQYIKIDSTKEKYAAIAEMAMGQSALDRFIVTTDNDRKVLQSIRTEAGCNSRECGIYQMHPGNRYNVPPPPTADVETVSSVLQIDEDLVFNCLVDNLRIDTKALAMSKELSEQSLLMSNGNGNAIRGGTIRDVYFLPDGDNWSLSHGMLQMRSNEKKMRRVIGVDHADALAQYKAEHQQLSIEFDTENERARNAQRVLKEHQTKFQNVRRELRQVAEKLENTSSRLETLRYEQETAVNDTVDNTAELEEDVSNAENYIETLKGQATAKKREIQELEPAIEAAKAHLLEVSTRNGKVAKDLAQAEQNLQDFLQNQSQHQQKLEKKRQKIAKAEADIATIKQETEIAETKYQDSLSYAKRMQYSMDKEIERRNLGDETEGQSQPDPPSKEVLAQIEPVQVTKSMKWYEGKIKRMKDLLKSERRKSHIDGLEKDAAKQRYLRAREDLSKRYNQNISLKKNIDNLQKDIKKREKLFKDFRKYLQKSTDRAFDEILQLKGSSGSLEYDHEKKTLRLIVQKENTDEETQSSDIKSLSGGERSFSTLAFVQALGERLETPFRVLDEFDVFMDAVSRKHALDALVDVAQKLEHRQFIFITPQDLSSLTPSNTLRIHRMKPPVRSLNATRLTQQTLD